MKKLLTFSMIVAVVALMSNCSPKVAKTTSKTEKAASIEKSEPKQNTTQENPNFSGSATINTNPDDLVKIAQGDRTNEEQIKLLSQSTDARVQSGKELYENTCNKCHGLFRPDSRNANAWVEIMKDMGPKSKINHSTYLMISSYLVKNAGS